MSDDLVFRLRTCAAAMLVGNPDWLTRVRDDAANLMIEASNLIDELDPPEPEVRDIELEEASAAIWGEPMKVLEAQKATGPTWVASGDSLPSVAPKPCPSCGNVAARKVRIANRHLFLTCPMCAHEWEYKP
jgi:hypothetical protein